MRHVRQDLLSDARRAFEWARVAAGQGRAADAQALERLADVAQQAAERFATLDRLVSEDEDDAFRVRALLFDGCAPAAGVDPAAECCPWTKEGLCKGCPFAHRQWTFGGKRYQCYSEWTGFLWQS